MEGNKNLDFFKNQKGSAIFIVMVTAGVISSLIVYLTNLTNNTNKKVTDDARVLSYRSLVSSVKNKLYSGKTCTSLLSGQDITNAFVREGVSIILDLKLASNVRPLKKPSSPNDKWFLKGGTSIEDVRLTVSEMVRAPVVFEDPAKPNLIAAKGFIFIDPDHHGTGAGLSWNKEFRIPIFLFYKVDGSSRVLDSCFEPDGEAYICTKVMHGAYDLNSNPKCQPQRFCFHGSQNIVTSWMNCTPPFNDYKLVGDSAYSCEWCNSLADSVSSNCYDSTAYRFFYEPDVPNMTNPYAEFNSLDEASGTGFPLNCGSSGGGGSTTGGTTGGGGGSVGGGWGCFVAGTEITLFDGTIKAIEDVKMGDELKDVRGHKVKPVSLISYDYEGPIFSVNGGPYFFTPNHPFLTLDGWKSLDPAKSIKESPDLVVSKMKVGDVLIKSDGLELIMSLDSIQVKEKVYNFSLDGTHEYLANDYAVHNKLPTLDSGAGGGGTIDPVMPSM